MNKLVTILTAIAIALSVCQMSFAREIAIPETPGTIRVKLSSDEGTIKKERESLESEKNTAKNTAKDTAKKAK